MLKNISGIIFTIVILSGAVLLLGCNTEGNQNPADSATPGWKQIVDLSGEWKFSVGDNMDWATSDFNDDNWEKILVPSSWENQGFHGYDGYAWYRTSFRIPQQYKNRVIYALLGFVDDVDQVYINGKLVGYSGSFPPEYSTAYDVERKYPVPSDLLDFSGNNTIAVRVYDEQLEGGITRGNVGIYTPEYDLENGINLTGRWKFKTGDSLAWKNPGYNDANWNKIIVPGDWEYQGYPDYDGYAWYRRTIKVPEDFKNEKLILVMGKIDDLDEVFVNGKSIGRTGEINNPPQSLGDTYLKLRGYYLNKDDIKYGEDNLIAVRVYDGFRFGGIFEGPLSLVPQKEYIKYWNKIRRGDNFIDKIFE